MLTLLLLYLAVGIIGGITAGLLGVGGGIVIVPLLILIFPLAGIPPEYSVHMAVATTLMITVFTSISSIYAHFRKGGVLMHVIKNMLIGLIVGAILGAVTAMFLPGRALAIIFGIYALWIAARMGLGMKPKASRTLPGKKGLFFASGILSYISALVGMGGGTLVVPFLTRCNVPMKNAVATSAVCTLPIALAGGLSFLFESLHIKGLPAWSLGYVYLPAWATVASMSVIFAPLGARLAHRLEPDQLKRIFAIFLLCVGVNMLFF